MPTVVFLEREAIVVFLERETKSKAPQKQVERRWRASGLGWINFGYCSEVIKGLVFKKNTAHKHMPTACHNPRLLLLKGVLGHSDVGLSSFNSMDQVGLYIYIYAYKQHIWIRVCTIED